MNRNKERSEAKQAAETQPERLLHHTLDYCENIIATLREPFLVLTKDLRIKSANRSFYQTFHVSKEETENQSIYDLGNRQWTSPRGVRCWKKF